MSNEVNERSVRDSTVIAWFERFFAAAEYGDYQTAADRLGVAYVTIQQAVKNLEGRYEVELFEKTEGNKTKPNSPTAAGQILRYIISRHQKAMADEADEYLAAVRDGDFLL